MVFNIYLYKSYCQRLICTPCHKSMCRNQPCLYSDDCNRHYLINIRLFLQQQKMYVSFHIKLDATNARHREDNQLATTVPDLLTDKT